MSAPGRTPTPKHLAIMATDKEWEAVRRNARRRGIPMARYVVDLARRDGGSAPTGPDMTLSPIEQREILAKVREVRTLLLGGEGPAPPTGGLRERIAKQFAAWTVSMAGGGRRQELHAALAAVLGDDRARSVAEGLAPGTPPPPPGPAEAGEPPDDGQGTLL